ncbi:ankyrin repeat domain-containing protein, partial [Endozoicomonas sp. ONNA2]|uniref:ankyrin repeat domain-containing protein n=1 Tax=Endozoicomonas sp. ONNA2 TaxID=2828741 RepID=UPI002147CBB7
QDGYTPLHFAAENNSVRCLEALIKAGANINAREKKNGYTPLHIAAARGSTECLQNLLEFDGVDISRALHCAAATGNAGAVKALMAFPGIQVNEKDNNGDTAFHLAVRNGKTENAKVLLGIDRTLGFAALYSTDRKFVKLLLVNDRSFWLEALKALHCASSSGDTEFVKLLLAIDRSLAEYSDHNGWTALQFAADNGCIDTANALLGCWRTRNQLKNLNKKNIDGDTALHLAAHGGYPEIVKAFLAIPGIRVNDKNNTGCTALDLATSNGHTVCKELLEEQDRS